jgi:tRNA-binding EMAP/Myf-like protein
LGYKHGFRVFDFGSHKFWIEYYGVDKQVGLVLSVSDHPISEKLYVCKVEVAPGETRQVVAGLKKFVHEYELERRKVCVILNLKPAKLAGQVSEAMILAGSVPTPDGSEIVKVQSYPYPCPLILHLILFV